MTLTEVQNNFNVWREKRRHSKERIPDELWQQVATIYSSYPPSIICRRLSMSGQQLKKAMLGDGFASFLPTPPRTFPTVKDEPLMCELSLEHLGARLTVKAPMSAFDEVLSKLAGHMPC